MSKWYWFKVTMKELLVNLFIKDCKARTWMVSEDRLEYLQQVERDYAKIKAERDMWYNIAQVSNEKLNATITWVNANWRAQNEK